MADLSLGATHGGVRPVSTARVRYQTIEFGDVDIHVRTLRDLQQFDDRQQTASKLGISSASWPMFGVVWESGEVLARLMSVHDIAGLRVLEVGCGIALTSLVLGQRRADITATDHHPEAASFLEQNAALNRMPVIPFVRTAWDERSAALGKFDLVVGSDLLYERPHAQLLSAFIDRHAEESCEVIIVDPGRGMQAQFTRRMAGFGYAVGAPLQPVAGGPAAFRGQILHYVRRPAPAFGTL